MVCGLGDQSRNVDFVETYFTGLTDSSVIGNYLFTELSPSGGGANSAATQEFLAFYGTRRFIAVFTRAPYWINPIHTIPSL
jgi:hypothetical protein